MTAKNRNDTCHPNDVTSQVASGTRTTPENVMPACEIPSAVPRRRANQFEMMRLHARLLVSPTPIPTATLNPR